MDPRSRIRGLVLCAASPVVLTVARRVSLAAVLLLALLLVGPGCLGRSPHVRYFMLGVEDVAATDPSVAERVASDVSVLVGPVRLPAYLDRPELVRLAADGEVALDGGHRWLGSFEANFLRAVSLGVAKRLGSNEVVAHPSKAPFPIEYDVRLHVDDLIVEAGGTLRVRIRWALIGPAGRGTGPLEGPPARLFTLDERRSGVGSSPEARVRAHEAVLGELATRIADAIVEIESGAAGS